MVLFEPGQIGSLKIKNRIVMAPMFAVGMTSPSPNLGFSQRGIDYYSARAKGGVGLITTGLICPNEKLEKSCGYPMVNAWSDILWLSELAEAVHDYGAKIFVQFSAGLGCQGPPNPDLPHGGLVAPSPIPAFFDPNVICRELTTEEIEELVYDFGHGASLIANAGIDGIEIHAHQGYLLTEFLTPRTNKRTDEYGGDLDGRLRIIIELVHVVKKAAGADYPVTVRYGLTDHLEGEIEGASRQQRSQTAAWCMWLRWLKRLLGCPLSPWASSVIRSWLRASLRQVRLTLSHWAVPCWPTRIGLIR